MKQQIPLLEAEYNGFPVLFQPDGYVNATQVAKQFGKESYEFLRLQSTQDYLQALEEDLAPENHRCEIKLVITVSGGRGNGTWLHPSLAVIFARWLNVKFAIWCDRQIRDILIDGKETSVKISSSERILLDRIGLNSDVIHYDYFPVFNESLHVLKILVKCGIEFDHKTVPDNSIGQMWAKYWKKNPQLAKEHGERKQFEDSPHVFPDTFPQSHGYDKLPWHYPMSVLQDFRTWLQNEYIPNSLHSYVKRKEIQQHLPPGCATKLLPYVH
jgi:hypothetical protein